MPMLFKANKRRASILVEFAIIAMVLYLLFAGLLAFGRMLYCSQVVNQAVDTAAQELAHTPLPASITFEEVRDNTAPTTEFRDRVFSEDYLAIDITPWIIAPGGMTLYEYVDSLNPPMVNRMLVQVMYIEEVPGGTTLLRYPGAIITSATAPSGYTVVVPTIQAQSTAGPADIRWVRVLEEVDTEAEPGDNTGSAPDPFPVNSPQGGLAALRLHYPFQSVGMSGYINGNYVIADDGAITELNAPGGALVSPTSTVGPHAGPYGLGTHLAWGETVRPFRKVITAQAIYRREVFE